MDAVTGVHLTDVQVLQLQDDESFLQPGEQPSRSLAAGTRSPVQVILPAADPGLAEALCLAGAGGYAWKSVTLNSATGGERTVELVRAASLEVSISGEVPETAQFVLRDRAQGYPLHARSIPPGGTWIYDGLAPGSCHVSVLLGAWYRDPLPLAEATVAVKASELATVTLEVEAPGKPDYGALAGTLIIPPAWELAPERVRLELTRTTPSKALEHPNRVLGHDQLEQTPGRPGEYRFAVEHLEVGTYRCTLKALLFDALVEIPSEGVLDLVLEVPPPVHVLVRAIDALTRKPIVSLPFIAWSPKWPTGVHSGHSVSVAWNGEAGGFPIRVPRMTISAKVVEGHQEGEVTFEAAEGREATIEVHQIPSMAIELRHGADQVPFPEDFAYEVTPLAREGYERASGASAGGIWFGVSQPGEYRVTLPSIEGFLPLEDLVVDIQPGPQQTTLIELVAK